MGNWRYAGVDFCDTANGKGVGVVLFLQGCSHHCAGCHNPETWDFLGGKPFTEDTEQAIMNAWSRPYISRLTLSGGDPFDNVWLSMRLAVKFKTHFHDKKLWIYTGYHFEELQDKSEEKYFLLSIADVIVDGPFIMEQRDLSLPYRGSRNQRIIDIKKTLAAGKIVLFDLDS